MARSFGDGVRVGLRQLEDQGGGGSALAHARWLWLLHDDSAPEPEALAELIRAGDSGPSIALVGAKQREWARPDRLISVGVTVSPGGRRFTGIEDSELDQGQHDGREDVYGVGTAGALILTERWDALGGTDPALGPFGDGLDLSRRVRLAGSRVVVAPRAIVRHARASYLGLRPEQGPVGVPTPSASSPDDDGAPAPDVRRSFRARRVALLHSRLVDAPAVFVPVLAVAAAIGAIVRALARVATKEPRLAADEVAATVHVLRRPGVVRRSRARIRADRRLPTSCLRPLRASWRDVWRVGRDRRLSAVAARRVRVVPDEFEVAERAAAAARRRAGLIGVLAASVTLVIVTFGPLVAVGPVTGGALLPTDAGLGALWQRALGAWVSSSGGYPGPNDSFLGVLAVPTAILGGSAGAVVTGLVLAAVPLAGLGAWFAAGAATRSIPLRAWIAFVWAVAPALLLAIGQGRLGAVVAHVVLPWAALGLARALGVHLRDESGASPASRQAGEGVPGGVAAARVESSPGRLDPAGAVAAAAGAGLALAIAAAGAPVLVPAGLLVLGVLAVAAPRRRRYLWLSAIPPVVLLAPLILEAVRDIPGGSWRVVFADPGVPLASDTGPTYLPLLGWPMSAVAWPVLPEPAAGHAPLVAGAVVALAAALALARRRRWRVALTGWAVAAVGLAAALGASRVDVGVGGDLLGEASVVRGWAGAGTSLVVAGLLVAVAAGVDGFGAPLAGRSFGRRHVGAAVLAGLLVLAPLAATVAWAWRVVEARSSGATTEVFALRGAEAAVPALGLELQDPPQQASVLGIEPGETEVTAHLWRADGDRLEERSLAVAARVLVGGPGRTELRPPDQADEALAGLVAGLVVGTATNPSEELARFAVGVVVVPPGSGGAWERLIARLDATAGLERVTENPTGTVWRVAPPEGSALIGRVRIVSADGTVSAVVPSDGVTARSAVEAGEAERFVVLAERADPGWRAWLDGEPLSPRTVGWSQAFVLGPEGGELVVAYSSWRLTLVHTVQAVVLGLYAVLALPLRRRRVEVA